MPSKVILLVHGAWVNGASWEPFADRLEAQGYQVVVPSWPHMEGPPVSLRSAPRKELKKVGLDEIVAHYEAIARALPEPPILIGHSFGGLVVERMLADGVGDLGVALDPAPGRGIFPRPRAIATSLPVILGFGGVETISEKAFVQTFANSMDEAEAAEAWRQFVVPTPSRPFFQELRAPFGHATAVHWSRDERAPLLIVSSGEDKTIPRSMVWAAARKYQRRSTAFTAYRELLDRSHFLYREPGWETLCDDVVTWIEGEGAAALGASATTP